MIYGYARVSTDGQSVDAQVRRLRDAGAEKVFRETASGVRAAPDRPQLRRALARLEAGDVLIVVRLDRLARSTRDLLNTLAAITEKNAGFRSLSDAWADTMTPHGRLMLTVLGGLAEFERELIRARTGEGAGTSESPWRPPRPQAEIDIASTAGSDSPPRPARRDARRYRPQLQRQPLNDQPPRRLNMAFLTRTDPARNIDRFYLVEVMPSLFGDWTVLREWGRRGSPGTVRLSSYRRREEAQVAEQRTIKRRRRRGYRDP
jgi:predicted DNA-binding WGR domain protein